jgi:hypothetical protein
MNSLDVDLCHIVDEYLVATCQIKIGAWCNCVIVASMVIGTHLDMCIQFMYVYSTTKKLIHCLQLMVVGDLSFNVRWFSNCKCYLQLKISCKN